MKTIDKSKPVMVTGATGYVAGWLVKRLLEAGISVHAAVRNPEKKEKVAHLDKIAAASSAEITYFKADLLEEGAYAEAMKGCEVIFHTASPFTSNFKDAQKDLVDPAVKGTENVLNSVKETLGIKRVVLTSSCAAIYTDALDAENAPGGVLTEEIWNTTASLVYQPYSYSKVMAEKKAWEIADGQEQWDLVVINPSLVMGPMLNPGGTTSESFNILKSIGDGTMKMGVPKMGLGLVDVRDVADAHFEAAYNPSAKGRYITSAHNTDFLEMAESLLPKYGENFPLPKKAIPKWLLMLIGPLADKRFTRPYVNKNVNHIFKADNTKVKKELGIDFRLMQATMEDSFQVLIDDGILKSK